MAQMAQDQVQNDEAASVAPVVGDQKDESQDAQAESIKLITEKLDSSFDEQRYTFSLSLSDCMRLPVLSL